MSAYVCFSMRTICGTTRTAHAAIDEPRAPEYARTQSDRRGLPAGQVEGKKATNSSAAMRRWLRGPVQAPFNRLHAGLAALRADSGVTARPGIMW